MRRGFHVVYRLLQTSDRETCLRFDKSTVNYAKLDNSVKISSDWVKSVILNCQMNDLRVTIDSAIVHIGVTFLNAILHYALYRAVVATIMLIKETILCLFRRVIKFRSTTGTVYSPHDQSALSCNIWKRGNEHSR